MDSILVSILKKYKDYFKTEIMKDRKTSFVGGNTLKKSNERNKRMIDFENQRVFMDHQVNFFILI